MEPGVRTPGCIEPFVYIYARARVQDVRTSWLPCSQRIVGHGLVGDDTLWGLV